MVVAPASRRRSLFFFFFSIFFTVLRLAYSMLESEALINFKNSLSNNNNSQALNNWVANTNPCDQEKKWEGVMCNNDGFVSGLRLEGMGFSGKIDVDSLLVIKGFRTFSIKNNLFSGSIPEINRIGFLRALYLSGNQFSGEIPPDFFQKMRSLKKLWLSDNKFTGQIPSEIPELVDFHLENNQFSGIIPNLYRTSLVEFNVSNNKLEGEIPSSLSSFDKSSFLGNFGLCGEKLGKLCENSAKPPNPAEQSDSNSGLKRLNTNSNSKRNNSLKIAAIVVASSVLLLTLIVLLFLKVRQRKKRKEEAIETVRQGNNNHDDEEETTVVEVQVSTPVSVPTLSRKSSHCSSGRRVPVKAGGGSGGGGGVGELVMVNDEKGEFGMGDLMRAAAEVLGNGGFGSSYKAVMGNGVAVVVKRIREMNVLGKDEFDAEMRKLGSLRHKNILTPLAYHFRKDEKLVVSEYVPKGSLLYLLHGDRGPSNAELDWPARLKIIQGIIEGMLYLHTQLASSVLPHGNLKSSNILLGPEYEPMLVDYGLSPLINPANLTQALLAYKAPEASQEGQVSPKSDVYCLGVVILEILSGKFPSQYNNNGNGGIDVVEWAISAISEGKVVEMLDPQLASSTNSLNEMERLLHIGVACTASNPEDRLDMLEALRMIEDIQIESSQESITQGPQEMSRTSFGSSSVGSRSGYLDNNSS